ncbi:MAG: DUF2946 family protein [Pseudomonadota bacterium]|nr:DUF2946 family protein [Pseudomonadota bacterium]
MHFSAVSLRLSCWLALLAVLALALLPTVSHALAAARGQAAWAEVCTPRGARLVAAASADGELQQEQGAPASSAFHLEHCPLCALSTGDLGPAPSSSTLLPPTPSGVQLPERFLQAPCTPHAWRSAQPRAPPFVS